MLKYTARVAVLSIALSAGGYAMAESHSEAPGPNTVVATVNGTEITLGQMIIARSQLPPQYQQLPPDVLFSGVMDQLIQQQVLADSLEADPVRVTIALENERRSLLAGEVINTIVEGALTEEAIEQVYNDLVVSVGPAKEFNASHILVATEDEANAVLARIDAGESFEDLAREVSTDMGSGANGGSLGWFGQGMMVAPFEEAVMSLDAGAMSAPVQTQFGWHIIVLNDTREQEAPSLEDVREELENEVRNNAIESRLVELMDAADVVRPEEGAFDPSILSNLDLIAE
ncbi:peptidylprolyl isomerase [Flavimaricola marinus]|uniref:Parvulin-like PPIase n=1 Tax=Flavimaricola marinus TaxID=1819565 RepID=A0A238LCH6_9RHOB|nr:peptidylprolyl isomerase [Flavimaricola marinus]SMY07115.1 putative parvulin-type peptidyl-prolyl cis-trans isomerase precursor [Flavimaricola marinus]